MAIQERTGIMERSFEHESMKAIIKMFCFEKEIEILSLRPKIYIPIVLATPVIGLLDEFGGEVKKLVFDLVSYESGIARYEISREQVNKILEAI